MVTSKSRFAATPTVASLFERVPYPVRSYIFAEILDMATDDLTSRKLADRILLYVREMRTKRQEGDLKRHEYFFHCAGFHLTEQFEWRPTTLLAVARYAIEAVQFDKEREKGAYCPTCGAPLAKEGEPA